ncbi:MAG: hypothetical protein IT531_05015 [Burkholderiales bacterium]|nr:hypothetical protein [Burkholderiales bacterium]
MNAAFAALIAGVIAGGLVLDGGAHAWSQPLVDIAAWAVFALLIARSARPDRIAYLACLAFAAAGEVLLALVWGIYDYRLGNLPLFVPPGHVLLYALGVWLSARMPIRAVEISSLLVACTALGLALDGRDQLSLPLAVMFVLCVRYGPAPRLYAVMFVLALALELLGTGLGNWSWRALTPWFGWSALNPPFAAGAFYCMLDLLVTRVRPRSPSVLARTIV